MKLSGLTYYNVVRLAFEVLIAIKFDVGNALLIVFIQFYIPNCNQAVSNDVRLEDGGDAPLSKSTYGHSACSFRSIKHN